MDDWNSTSSTVKLTDLRKKKKNFSFAQATTQVAGHVQYFLTEGKKNKKNFIYLRCKYIVTLMFSL